MTPRYKFALVFSLALLVASAEWFIHAFYVEPREEAGRDLVQIADLLRIENQKPPAPLENRGVTVPDLLARVQELTAQRGVAVQALEPVAGGDGEQFKLSVELSYPDLIRFLANFESLQVSVTGFEVAPASSGTKMLAVSLTFAHTVTPGAASADRVKEFEGALRDKPMADPFDPSSGPLSIAGMDGNDLTWSLHLTSISEIGATRFATIDGRDYSVGDDLFGRTVTEIGNESVTLSGNEAGQDHQFFLRFRKPLGGPT